MTQEERVREASNILKKIHLPVVPEEVIWLETELRKENTNFFDIIQKLENCSGLVDEIISTANQVLVRVDHPISTISQAVNFLGAQSLYQLVISAHFKKIFADNRVYSTVLEHSIWTAKAMTLIERRTVNNEPDFAYSLGLFHNLGALVLSLYDQDKYADFFLQSRSFPLTALEKEEFRYGTNHCVLGTIIAKRWRLPRLMLEAIYRHHQLELDALPSLEIQRWVARLRLANGMVDQVCYDVYRTSEIKRAEEDAMKLLGMSSEKLQEMKNDFVKSFMVVKSTTKL